MHNQDQWIHDLYDAVVANAGHDGLKAADAKAAVAVEVTEAVIDGRITPEPSLIADLIVAHSMNPERSRRKASLHRELEYLIDALNGATVLGRDDPRFKQSFALGDGRDKTLGLWTADDWRESLNVRRAKSDEAMAAVQIYEDLVDRFTAAMFAASASVTAETYGDQAA